MSICHDSRQRSCGGALGSYRCLPRAGSGFFIRVNRQRQQGGNRWQRRASKPAEKHPGISSRGQRHTGSGFSLAGAAARRRRECGSVAAELEPKAEANVKAGRSMENTFCCHRGCSLAAVLFRRNRPPGPLVTVGGEPRLRPRRSSRRPLSALRWRLSHPCDPGAPAGSVGTEFSGRRRRRRSKQHFQARLSRVGYRADMTGRRHPSLAHRFFPPMAATHERRRVTQTGSSAADRA